MTLDLLKALEKGAPLNLAEHDLNFTNVETEVNAKANTADVAADLAGKVDTTDARLTDARSIAAGDYGLFTVSSGVAAVTAATAAQARDGTAGKPIDAARLKSMNGFELVASSAGVLTLNWATITSMGVKVDVAENITSIVVSNIPDYAVSVLFRITGSFSVTVPAHGATVSGRTFKRVDGGSWPSLPSTAGTRFILTMRKVDDEIYCQFGGAVAA